MASFYIIISYKKQRPTPHPTFQEYVSNEQVCIVSDNFVFTYLGQSSYHNQLWFNSMVYECVS